MADHEWQFRLKGDEFHINILVELFASEANIKKEANGETYLHMSLPYASNEVHAAQDASEELLAKLNAIARIVDGTHENVCVAAIGLKDPSGGPPQQFILGVGGIPIPGSRSSSTGIAVSVSEGAGAPTKLTKPVGDRVLDAADKNEHLDRALYLFGTVPSDWRGLYMVLEAAGEGNGGKDGLIAKNWVPQGQINRSMETANNYKAIRHAARHGKQFANAKSSATIKLTEAYEMVRTILENWSKEIA